MIHLQRNADVFRSPRAKADYISQNSLVNYESIFVIQPASLTRNTTVKVKADIVNGEF